MSHFTVLVVLPPTAPDKVDDALAAALAPFDENTSVDPYKSYLDEWQARYASAVDYFIENPGKADPTGTVADVLSAYTGDDVTEETDADTGVTMYYEMSTYNPQSKWDGWVVGGRWRDYFPVATVDKRDETGRFTMQGEPSWSNADERHKFGYVDGGSRGMLDFDRLRDERGTAAATEYDRWTAYTAGLPTALPFATFADSTDDIEDARKLYWAQPVMAKIKADRAAGNREFDSLFNEPMTKFGVSHNTYVQRARDQAVPGFAMLDLEGRWLAPGDMGWWGMSTDEDDDRVQYRARANEYLDSLAPDAIVIVVDCHV